jgi:hypothetical protein
MFNTSTLRPGLLVAIKTSLRGNVSYTKRDIISDHATPEGERFAKWETERTIADAIEFEAAGKVRREASYTVSKVCAATAFGHLCPEDKASELDEAMKQARAMVDAFNATAKITRIDVYMIAGRVAQDDVEAARAIRGELAQILATMEAGVTKLDPAAVRDAARRAQEIAQMLTAEGANKVKGAVDAARRAAREIVRAAKAGEVAAVAIDGEVARKIAAARTSFLDLDEQPLQVERSEVAPRTLDLDTPALSVDEPRAPVVSFDQE